MTLHAKRVLSAAARCEDYWKLSDAEKLVWIIERAYLQGRRHAANQRQSLAKCNPLKEKPSEKE